MITAANSPRPGVVGGFVLSPPGVTESCSFTALPGPPTVPTSAQITAAQEIALSGGSYSPVLGGEVEFSAAAGSALPAVTGIIGSGAAFNFRGAWASFTTYATNDVVQANDVYGVLQTWVAQSAFTSGPTFLTDTGWLPGLLAGQVYYIVGIVGGSIMISQSPGGGAIIFTSTAFGAGTVNIVFGVDGFGTGTGLVPALSVGALFAQGTLWLPSTPPVAPAAPANSYSYLAYNSSTGLYWTSNPLGTTAGDAVLGWVQTSGTDIVAASLQDVPITNSDTATSTVGVGGGVGGGGGGATPSSQVTSFPGGEDSMVPDGSWNLTPDLSKGWTHTATLSHAVAVKPPVNITGGATFIVKLTQDATGGRVIAFDAYYKGLASIQIFTGLNTFFSALFQVQADGLSAALMQPPSNGHPIT